MTISIIAYPDNLRSSAFGAITNSYTTLGSAITHPVRMFRLVNATDGDIFISLDGVNNQFFLPANSFILYDLTANRVGLERSTFVFAKGTQFYIKYSTAPTVKAVYLEIIYGIGE